MGVRVLFFALAFRQTTDHCSCVVQVRGEESIRHTSARILLSILIGGVSLSFCSVCCVPRDTVE